MVIFSVVAILVGLIFLLSAVTKALDPIYFIQHITDLKVTRDSWLLHIAFIFICAQGFVGAMLISRQLLVFTVPVSVVLLFVLMLLTLRGHLVSKIEDCGCYGGFVRLTVRQSITLDCILIAALLVAYVPLWGRPEMPFSLPQVAAALLAGGLFGALFLLSYRYYIKHDRLFVSPSPIRVGKPWREGWLGEEPGGSRSRGDGIVVFLSASCSSCKPWAKILKAIHQSEGLPGVTVALGVNQGREGEQAAIMELCNQVPVIMLSRRRITSLTRSPLPMTVLVENGVIKGKWIRKIPDFLIEQLKLRLAPQLARPAEVITAAQGQG